MASDLQFSAVIPTYNRAETLGRAIESILRQERKASEIVVIDDGSADNTRHLIAQYGGSVRYIYQENQGVSAARNRGVLEATNSWIAFLDSDDRWLPQHLGRIGQAIEKTDGQAAVYFSDLVLGPAGEGRHWESCGFSIDAPFELARDASDWACMEIQPMMLQASVIRKDRYLETGGLPVDLKTREDTLLFFKLGLLFPACAVCGCGTVMMDDGNGRLTEEFNGNSVEYSLATVTLFEEVAALAKLLHHRKHKMLVEELSYAHFGLGRASGRRGMYLDAVRAILLSALTNQRVFRRCLQDSFKKRLFTLMM